MQIEVSESEITISDVDAYAPPDGVQEIIDLIKDTGIHVINVEGINDKRMIRLSLSRELDEDEASSLQEALQHHADEVNND